MEGCFFCITLLPCNCSIRTAQYYIPERWDGCHHQHQEISKVHPVNLALLQEYFSDSQLKQITSQTTFPIPLNVSIPPFNIYRSNISEVIADDKLAHMNLKRMIDISKKNKVIFASLADSVFSSINYDTSSFPTELFLSILATGLASLVFVLLLILFHKYRYIALVLSVNDLLPTTEAYLTLPSFHYTVSPETQGTTDPPLTISDISKSSNLYVAILILVFFAL